MRHRAARRPSLQRNPHIFTAPPLLPKSPLHASPSIFLSRAIAACSAVNLSRQHVICPLMYAICNNHEGRETHTHTPADMMPCRTGPPIMTWRLKRRRKHGLTDSALLENPSLKDEFSKTLTHTNKCFVFLSLFPDTFGIYSPSKIKNP